MKLNFFVFFISAHIILYTVFALISGNELLKSIRKKKETLSKEEIAVSEKTGDLCGPSNPRGTGLRIEYFSEDNFRGNKTTDITKTKSVRWTGWIKPPVSGHYTFHILPAAAKVTLAKQILFDITKKDESNPSIDLVSGRYYPIIVEINRLKNQDSLVQLEWTTPYGARYVLPRASLYPPNNP